MKAVKVQYTVRPEYVEQNKRNIQAVMKALQANPVEGMYYSSYQLSDGNTFMHLNVAIDGETMSKLNDVAEFVQFRIQLKASEPLSPPKAEDISFVGSGWEMQTN